MSCVVPVFNGALYLLEAIDSIEAQAWRPLEIIVIDDGSTDATAEVITGLGGRVRALSQPNRGPAAARNAGIAAASGAFIALLDADDLWVPEKLALQMARFEARPDLDVSVGRARNWWIEDLRDEAGAAPDTMGGISVALIRRGVFDRLGLFDETLRHLDWTEWLLRASDAGAAVETLPDTLALRRIHYHNMSRNRGGEDSDERMRIAQARLARRRGART